MRQNTRRKLMAAAGAAWTGLVVSQAAFGQSYQSLLLVPPSGAPLTVPVGAGATSGEVGGVFLPGQDVVIDRLGFYDFGGDGLLNSHQVGIWTTSGGGTTSGDGKGKLVASVTVGAGTASPLIDGFRWVTLDAPVTLRASQYYVLGATVPNATGNDPFLALTTATWNPYFVGTWSQGTRYGRYVPNLTDMSEPKTLASSSFPNGIYGIANVGSLQATSTWTGSGGNGNWSTAGNWAGGTAPVFTGAASQLTFGAGSAATVTNNVVDANLRGVRFAAGAPAMTINGNGFTTIGGIANYGTNTQTFSNTGPVVLYNDQSVLAQNGSLVFNSGVDLGGTAPGKATIQVGSFYSWKDTTFNGKLTGSADVQMQGLGTVTMGNNGNDFTGNVSLLAGRLKLTASNALGARGSADNFTNTASDNGNTTIGALGNTYATVVTSGGINVPETFIMPARTTTTSFNPHVLNSDGNNSLDGYIYLTGGTGGHVLKSDAGKLTLTGLVGLVGTGSHTIYLQGAGDGELAMQYGIIEGSTGNTIGVAKQGTGTWTISRSGSNYSGATSVGGGKLVLDYTSDNGDLINGYTAGQPNAPLWMQGGTLVVKGSAGGATDQTVPSTLLNPGGGSIVVNPGAGQSATLHLNNITRVAGSGLDVSGAGTVTTTTANNALGMLGAWATHNGTNWATNSAGSGEGTIAPVSAAAYTADAWAADANTDVTASGSPAAGGTTGTLRFNAAGGQTVTLSGTNTLKSAGGSGAVLVTPNAGAAGTTITGGTLQGANATSGRDLIIHQFNTAGALTVASTIANAPNPASRSGAIVAGSLNTISGLSSTADLYVGMPVSGTGIPAGATITSVGASSVTISANGTAGTPTVAFTSANGLTKTGPGTLVLSGANTFTGPTYINGGTVRLDNAAALATSLVNVWAPESRLTVNVPAATVNGMAGYGTVDLGTNGLTVTGTSDDAFYGPVLGSGGLTISKTGGRSLIMHGGGSFTAPITVNAGARYITKSADALGTIDGGTTVNAGGELDIQNTMDTNEPITIAGTGISGGTLPAALHIYSTYSVATRGPLTLTGNASIYVENAANFVQSGNVGGNGFGLTLGGDNHSAGTISGAIGTGTGGVTVNTGNWFLTGANTYSGTTQMNGGYVTVSSLGTVGGGPSNLGQPTEATQNLTFTTAYGQVIYTGAGETTSRGMTFTTANGAFINDGGKVTFNGPITLNGKTLVSQGSGDLELTGAIGGTTAGGLSVVNTGTTTLSGSGALATATVSFGTLAFNPAAGAAFTATTINTGAPGTGGPGVVLRKSGAGSLTVTNLSANKMVIDGGLLAMAASTTTSKVATVNGLTISGTGVFDLSNNDLVVKYGTEADPVTTVAGYIRTGYHAGAWDGVGITSSAALAQANGATAIGYADDTAGARVLVKYTWYGDLNLDGLVDGVDRALMVPVSSGGTWGTGDLNYDGAVNADDWALFALGAAGQDGSIHPGVPEPTAAGVLVLGAIGAMARRARRRG